MAFRVLVATDRSLAKEIRDELYVKIAEALGAGMVNGEYFDTNEEGKGWRPGTVSFSIKPVDWQGKFNGGILIQCSFDVKELRSTAPETGTPEYKAWVESGGNAALRESPAVIAQLRAGYYNKSPSGGVEEWSDLGQVIFTVNEVEEVTEVALDDPGKAEASIKALMKSIEDDPPEGAFTSKQVRKSNPYTSVRKFRLHINEEGRNTYSEAELKRLHEETGKSYPMLKKDLEKANAFAA